MKRMELLSVNMLYLWQKKFRNEDNLMVIREYTKKDELEWLRCRVLSFLDCSYYNDVLTQRETYENDAICLVAEALA